MHIGIVGPINLELLFEYLEIQGDEPKGYKGATAPALLVSELVKRGHQITIFTISPDLNFGDSRILNGKKIQIYIGSTRIKFRYKVLDLYKFERNFLYNNILLVRPQILHSHWQYEYSWASLDTGIPTLVTCRDSPIHVFKHQTTLFRFIRLCMAWYVIIRAKNITATSSYLQKNIKYLTFGKKILVIPNFEPDWIFTLYKSKIKYSKSPKLIMINNGFFGLKNVKTGIIAFNIFKEKFPDATLHLYGVGSGVLETAHKWCLQNKIVDNIFFHGQKNFNDLMGLLSQHHVLLHTSKEETFGNVLAEAMAQGIPVIGGKKSGAVPWVIGENYKGGILTDIESPKKVSEALEYILNDELVYDNFSSSANKVANEKFKSIKILAQYENAYKIILEKL